jgi:hypothetical protein
MKHKANGPNETRVLIEAADWGFQPKFKEEGAETETEVIEESTEETEEETVVEAVEEEDAHFCPLCESKLEEEISDEILAEHINDILEVVARDEEEESDEDE